MGSSQKVMYVSGEESERQLKMRAERLGVKNDGIYVLAETELSEILDVTQELSPDILIIDSIQTLYSPDASSSPGSVSQVKDCTMSLMRLSKSSGITIFLVGHVNKEGAIAGPKVLEHMVDCVLYFEGERSLNYRILRAAKNRYGSTNEIGVFEMLDNGLSEVANPSEMLLSGRPEMTPGTCVTCVIEGTRPILAEIQALVTPSSANMPRRNANGVEYNRAMMLLAVLQQRGGLRVSGCDAYINVIGGLNLDDPGADIATILALASSYMDKPIRGDVAVFGEVGLTGELRQVSQINPRLAEIKRLGFKACILPQSVKGKLQAPSGLELIHVKTIGQAIEKALTCSTL
jgi:DNA repair protein RadA/Sms